MSRESIHAQERGRKPGFHAGRGHGQLNTRTSARNELLVSAVDTELTLQPGFSNLNSRCGPSGSGLPVHSPGEEPSAASHPRVWGLRPIFQLLNVHLLNVQLLKVSNPWTFCPPFPSAGPPGLLAWDRGVAACARPCRAAPARCSSGKARQRRGRRPGPLLAQRCGPRRRRVMASLRLVPCPAPQVSCELLILYLPSGAGTEEEKLNLLISKLSNLIACIVLVFQDLHSNVISKT